MLIGCSLALLALMAPVVMSASLRDSASPFASDWGQPVRLKHLYAAGRGLHLRIHPDGSVDGAALQDYYSLVEMRPDLRSVAVRGVATSLYLCMDGSGRLYGSATYTPGECSFSERILPSGYSSYTSVRHGTPLRLGEDSSTHFLPLSDSYPQHPPWEAEPEEWRPQWQPQLDSMNPFGKLSQGHVQSPSFGRR